jgi:hypothetical protein
MHQSLREHAEGVQELFHESREQHGVRPKGQGPFHPEPNGA